ncbi:Thaumatin-like protein [Capsicum annuum]|uniref:Thaumatin-like protein n=1 Tax=Capsicum annuum TaxID=4072 RepID=A0A2G2Y8U9_CAPAN|nr:Thaumatin-like protein [Capsicum annuum]
MAHPQTLAEYALNQFNNLDFFNISLCPKELRTSGGCNNPCTVFNTNEYCCTSGDCGETNYSKFFKQRCPNSFSYPQDDAINTLICPSGTKYRVVFCP